MIRVIHGHQRRLFPREIDGMHKLRKKVFHQRMAWQVPIISDWEVDGFDAMDPVYLLALNEREDVVGTMRLLPTTGFNMLNDVFPQLLPDGSPVYSPRIWEVSRLAVDADAGVAQGDRLLGVATAELAIASNEIAMAAGVSHFVAVIDAFMHRTFKRAGCAGEPISPPQRIGSTLCYAVAFEMGDELDANFRRAGGITGPVLEKTIRELGLPSYALAA